MVLVYFPLLVNGSKELEGEKQTVKKEKNTHPVTDRSSSPEESDDGETLPMSAALAHACSGRKQDGETRERTGLRAAPGVNTSRKKKKVSSLMEKSSEPTHFQRALTDQWLKSRCRSEFSHLCLYLLIEVAH